MALPHAPRVSGLAAAGAPLCIVAIHREAGTRYLGISRRTLAQRKNEHGRAEETGRTDGPFHGVLRLCGQDAFTWLALAEAGVEIIELLEAALIATWGAPCRGRRAIRYKPSGGRYFLERGR